MRTIAPRRRCLVTLLPCFQVLKVILAAFLLLLKFRCQTGSLDLVMANLELVKDEDQEHVKGQ